MQPSMGGRVKVAQFADAQVYRNSLREDEPEVRLLD
jgi:hypothetical protein